MKKIQILNKSKKVVGLYDREDKTYYRLVSKKQQFVHPKYSGMLAVSQDILQRLAKLGCEKFCFTLTEWEDKPFDAIITFKDFLLHREELFFMGKRNSDKQFGVRLNFWTRMYRGQEKL